MPYPPTPSIWTMRTIKGSALTHVELDDNQKMLNTKINDTEGVNLGPGPYFYVGKNKNADDGQLLFRSFIGLSGVSTYVSGSSIIITSSGNFCDLPDGIAAQEVRNCDCSVNQILGYCGCGTIGLSTSGVTFNPNSADKYTFPCYDGPANFHLCTDGSGQLSWCAGGSGSGGTSGDTYISNVTFNDDDLCITRSDGQVWCVDFSGLTPYEYGTGFNAIQPRKPTGSNLAEALVSNIGGGSANTVFNTAKYSNIGGGHINRIRSEDGFIGGGESNVITAFPTNEIGATTATTEFSGTTYRGASTACTHSCCYSADTSGYTKTITYTAHTGTTIDITPYSAVSYNSHNSVIGGGIDNKIYGSHSFVGGGAGNEIYGVDKTQFFGVTITSTPYSSHEYSGVTSFTGVTTGCTATGQTFSGITFTGLTDTGYTVTRLEYTGVTYIPLYSTIAGGRDNLISGNTYTFIGGGKGNKVLGPESKVSSIVGGLAQSILSGSNYSFIGGGISNEIQHGGHSAFIGGGQENKMLGDWNVSDYANPDYWKVNQYSFIGGGFNNTMSGSVLTPSNVIVGGINNNIMTSRGSSIVGGWGHHISGATMSFIGGGFQNTISGDPRTWLDNNASVIGGGVKNKIYGGKVNTIGGGNINTITGNTHATIGGGAFNLITDTPDSSTALAVWNIIAGGGANHISGATAGFIGGGLQNKLLVNSDAGSWQNAYSFIGGGVGNIQRQGIGSAIIGGQNSESSASYTFMGTSYNCIIRPDAKYGTILNGGHSTTSGANIISGASYYSTIINGSGNTVTQNAGASVVLGTINRQANEPFTVFTNGLDVFTDVKDFGGATIDMKYFRYRGRLANEQAGRWLKCVDNEGNAVWDDINMPSTGSTDILLSAYTSGCTLYLEFTHGHTVTADTCNLITPYRYGAGVNSIETVQSDNYVHAGSTSGSIGGGQFNKVTSHYGLDSYDGRVGGGIYNALSGSPRSFIGGGFQNIIEGKMGSKLPPVNSGILAGYMNTIYGSLGAIIVGGGANSLHQSQNSFIGAGYGHVIGAKLSGTSYNSILNGYRNWLSFDGGFETNRQSNYSTILNGQENIIYSNYGTMRPLGPRQEYSTILNGTVNHITGDTSSYNTIGNGMLHVIYDNHHTTILGGEGNKVYPQSHFGFIGGGYNSKIGTPSLALGQPEYATIVNGKDNTVLAHVGHIMGGTGNTINRVATSSAIIGCNDLTATEPNTTYMCGVSAGVVSAHTIVANHIILSGVTATGKFTHIGDYLANNLKTITHPLNTEDVIINVWNQSKQRIDAEIYYVSPNQIQVAVSSDMSNVKTVIIG